MANDFKSRTTELKPRERIETAGSASVASAVELLAIILKTGAAGCDVMELSRRLIDAFGGVEIGNDIAVEAATAIPISTVEVPPITLSLSPIPAQTTVRIGMSRAAVAVLEIKLDNRKQTKPAMTRMTIGLQLPNGILSTATLASPVPFMAKPRANPPATIQITPQSMSCKSFAVITPVKAKIAIGNMATVLALTPNCLPQTHMMIVNKKVSATTQVRQFHSPPPSILISMVF